MSRERVATAALRMLIGGEIVDRVALELAATFTGDGRADELVLKHGVSFAAVFSAGLADKDTTRLANGENYRRLETAFDCLNAKSRQTDLHLVFGSVLSLCVEFPGEVHGDRAGNAG